MKLTDTMKHKSPYMPLEECYTGGGLRLPRLTRIKGENIPQPYKDLLVHKKDMTTTLEEYHDDSIHLHLVRLGRIDASMIRHVVLLLDETHEPVEFGSINIHLSRFSGAPRRDILECWKPFGGILNEYRIEYESRPVAFFKVKSDDIIQSAFKLTDTFEHYGRCNTIVSPDGGVLAEVVEILPPMDEKEKR